MSIHHLDPNAWYVSAVPVGAAIEDAGGYTGTVVQTYPLGTSQRCLVTVSGDDVPRHRDYGRSEIVRVLNVEREPMTLMFAGSFSLK